MKKSLEKFFLEDSIMLKFENEFWDKKFAHIAGIDEVGRGPLAGPVVAAGVIFPANYDKIPIVDDSKKLSQKRRDAIYELILNDKNIIYTISEISVEQIDKLNILRASQLAMKEVILKLNKADIALIDGLPVPDFPLKNKSIIKGDSKSASIAAASILAKVYRDKLMMKYDAIYPGYNFIKNMGYGTKEHLQALKKRGVTPIHRKSFAPVRRIIHPPPEQLNFVF